MSIVKCDGYLFDFSDAISAFRFDSTDKNDPNFHGAPMKAVDVVAEFENDYVFIEIKNFHDIARYEEKMGVDPEAIQEKKDALKYLKETLKYKFRDSLLYRYAESKPEKPVHYICILNLTPSTLYSLEKTLSRELPIGTPCRRWKKPLAKSCIVINELMFNAQFPRWRMESMCCPICKDKNARQTYYVSPDIYSIQCAKCGFYEITGSAYAWLSKNRKRPLLSQALKTLFDRGEKPMINTINACDIIGQAGLYDAFKAEANRIILELDKHESDRLKLVNSPTNQPYQKISASKLTDPVYECMELAGWIQTESNEDGSVSLILMERGEEYAKGLLA